MGREHVIQNLLLIIITSVVPVNQRRWDNVGPAVKNQYKMIAGACPMLWRSFMVQWLPSQYNLADSFGLL
jgi:hypothetical protein